MAHQPPARKSWIKDGVPLHTRVVTATGIQYGGVRYDSEELRPLEGKRVGFHIMGVSMLGIVDGLSDTDPEFVIAEAQAFVDAEAVDAFLSLRDNIPKPYKPFFSTTQVVESPIADKPGVPFERSLFLARWLNADQPTVDTVIETLKDQHGVKVDPDTAQAWIRQVEPSVVIHYRGRAS